MGSGLLGFGSESGFEDWVRFDWDWVGIGQEQPWEGVETWELGRDDSSGTRGEIWIRERLGGVGVGVRTNGGSQPER